MLPEKNSCAAETLKLEKALLEIYQNNTVSYLSKKNIFTQFFNSDHKIMLYLNKILDFRIKTTNAIQSSKKSNVAPLMKLADNQFQLRVSDHHGYLLYSLHTLAVDSNHP